MDFFSSKVVNSFNVLLPNLRYKNINGGEIYFKCKNPIKLILNNKKKFVNDFLLKNLDFEKVIDYYGIDLYCTIIKYEYDDGLKINIKYEGNEYNYMSAMQKIGQYVECSILGLNTNDLESIYYDYSDESYNNKINEFVENISDNSEEYVEELSENENPNISNENTGDYGNFDTGDNMKFYDEK